MNEISPILDQEFLKFAKARRNFGRPSPDNFVDEWNRKLLSAGIVIVEEPGQLEGAVSNPAGGWIQVNPEVAMKILVLGIP